jgi:trimethylamine:corrinoid methyltransferase-like protein
MERPIYEGGSYNVLSEKEISRIHEASVRVLENVGFEMHYQPALELFEVKGSPC